MNGYIHVDRLLLFLTNPIQSKLTPLGCTNSPIGPQSIQLQLQLCSLCV